MNRQLKLEVVLAAVDKATRPIKAVLNSSQGLSKQLKETKDALKGLEKQQGSIERLRQLREQSKAYGEALRKTKDSLADYQAKLENTRTAKDAMMAKTKLATKEYMAEAKAVHALANPTAAQVANLARMKGELEKLEREKAKAINSHRRSQDAIRFETKRIEDNAEKRKALAERIRQCRTQLAEAGIKTHQLARHEEELKVSTSNATGALKKQSAELEVLNKRQQRLNAVRAKYDKTKHLADRLGGIATDPGDVSRTVLGSLKNPLSESKHYQLEEQRLASLGLGNVATNDAIKYAQAMKTYGTSTRDNLTLMRDAMTVFADEHHAKMVVPTLAKMKFANQAMYGEEHGADNERKFMDMLKVIELRGGLASKKAFENQANIVQQVITSTGGRVAGSEWLDVIKTGGLAAKGMDDQSFYYKMEPLVQEMGGHRTGTALMSAYQNLYQGKTTKRSAQLLDSLGLIGDKSKVSHDKTGQISYLNPGALKGGELFRKSQFDWMEKVLLPTLATKGITSKDQILDAMGGIFSNRTASNLFSQMYLQREQIHKNATLNAGADNIDQLHRKAKNTGDGAEIEMAAKRANLYKQMGDAVLPAYTQALALAAGALQHLTEWMQANPTAAKAIVFALAGMAAAIGVFAAVLGPLAIMRLGMSMLGIQLGSQTLKATAFSKAMDAISPALKNVSGASGGAASAIRTALAKAWKDADPRKVATDTWAYAKTLKERIPAASQAAWLATKQWGRDLGDRLRLNILSAHLAAKQYTAQLWQTVKAQLAANRAAAAGKWQGLKSYVATKGMGGMGKDALQGGWNMVKGGAINTVKGLGGALMGLGRVILFVGRLALMNPIGLALAAAAFLVIKYWEPIKAWFGGFWKGLTAGLAPLSGVFSAAFSSIGTALAPLKPVWDWLIAALGSAWDWISKLFTPINATKQSLDAASASGQGFGNWLASIIMIAAKVLAAFIDLPIKFVSLGANIMQSLVTGITNCLPNVKAAITGAGEATINWFKEKLGIHSPSRVFTELGGFTMAGLHQGIANNQGAPVGAVISVAKKLTAAGAGITLGMASTTAAVASVPIDTRAPISVQRAAPAASAAPQFNITIHAAPGMNEQQLAQLVAREIERQQRQTAARGRSRLTDKD